MPYQHTMAEMFSWEIRRKRKQKHWTQTFVALKVGITTWQLQNIESGICDPHTSVSLSLAHLLDIGIDKYRDLAFQERHAQAFAKLAQ